MNGNQIEQNISDLLAAGALAIEDGNHGEYRPRRNEFTSKGTAFIRAADINNGRVLFDAASKINDSACDRIRKGIGAGGDVILSHKGTVGKMAYVPFDAPPFVCSPQTTFWRVLDEEKINRDYLYAYMRSPHFTQQLASRQNETDMAAYVSLTAQRGLAILLPGIEHQHCIGAIIGSLDDKIELNRRTNRALEEMARAIFKAWFIDFEPVKAKAEGATHFPGMPQEVFDELPDSFVDSEIGPIPEGWQTTPIGDLVEVVGGATPRTKNPVFWEGGENSFCTPKDMSKLNSPIILSTERHITKTGVGQISSGQLPAGTVILSSRAPIGYLALAAIPLSVNQGIIAMKTGKVPNIYVLLWTEANMNVIEARAGGSTFAEISKRNFRPIPALHPSDSILSAFMDVAHPLFKMIEANERECNVLVNIRDYLLPKLISGELPVSTDTVEKEE